MDLFFGGALIGIGAVSGLFAWFMIDAGINNYAKSLVETASYLHEKCLPIIGSKRV